MLGIIAMLFVANIAVVRASEIRPSKENSTVPSDPSLTSHLLKFLNHFDDSIIGFHLVIPNDDILFNNFAEKPSYTNKILEYVTQVNYLRNMIENDPDISLKRTSKKQSKIGGSGVNGGINSKPRQLDLLLFSRLDNDDPKSNDNANNRPFQNIVSVNNLNNESDVFSKPVSYLHDESSKKNGSLNNVTFNKEKLFVALSDLGNARRDYEDRLGICPIVSVSQRDDSIDCLTGKVNRSVQQVCFMGKMLHKPMSEIMRSTGYNPVHRRFCGPSLLALPQSLASRGNLQGYPCALETYKLKLDPYSPMKIAEDGRRVGHYNHNKLLKNTIFLLSPSSSIANNHLPIYCLKKREVGGGSHVNNSSSHNTTKLGDGVCQSSDVNSYALDHCANLSVDNSLDVGYDNRYSSKNKEFSEFLKRFLPKFFVKDAGINCGSNSIKPSELIPADLSALNSTLKDVKFFLILNPDKVMQTAGTFNPILDNRLIMGQNSPARTSNALDKGSNLITSNIALPIASTSEAYLERNKDNIFKTPTDKYSVPLFKNDAVLFFDKEFSSDNSPESRVRDIISKPLIIESPHTLFVNSFFKDKIFEILSCAKDGNGQHNVSEGKYKRCIQHKNGKLTKNDSDDKLLLKYPIRNCSDNKIQKTNRYFTNNRIKRSCCQQNAEKPINISKLSLLDYSALLKNKTLYQVCVNETGRTNQSTEGMRSANLRDRELPDVAITCPSVTLTPPRQKSVFNKLLKKPKSMLRSKSNKTDDSKLENKVKGARVVPDIMGLYSTNNLKQSLIKRINKTSLNSLLFRDTFRPISSSIQDIDTIVKKIGNKHSLSQYNEIFEQNMTRMPSLNSTRAAKNFSDVHHEKMLQCVSASPSVKRWKNTHMKPFLQLGNDFYLPTVLSTMINYNSSDLSQRSNSCGMQVDDDVPLGYSTKKAEKNLVELGTTDKPLHQPQDFKISNSSNLVIKLTDLKKIEESNLLQHTTNNVMSYRLMISDNSTELSSSNFADKFLSNAETTMPSNRSIFLNISLSEPDYLRSDSEVTEACQSGTVNQSESYDDFSITEAYINRPEIYSSIQGAGNYKLEEPLQSVISGTEGLDLVETSENIDTSMRDEFPQFAPVISVNIFPIVSGWKKPTIKASSLVKKLLQTSLSKPGEEELPLPTYLSELLASTGALHSTQSSRINDNVKKKLDAILSGRGSISDVMKLKLHNILDVSKKNGKNLNSRFNG